MAESDYVLTILDAEWREISRSLENSREFDRWRQGSSTLGIVESLPALLRAIDEAPLAQSSDLVWELLELVGESELATRVVLQAIVPGLAGELRWLIGWARRTDAGLLAAGDIDQMLVLAGLEAIAHAAGRRRAWPISSILRRTHRILMRETRLRDEWYDRVDVDALSEETIVSGHRVDVRPGTALVELLGRATKVGAVTERDARLLWLIGVEGYTSSELAGSLGISPRAVATRRLRAENRLAEMVAVAS